jgi:hypothetical protein
VYIGTPIFWAMEWRAEWIQAWIPWLVRRLVPSPLAELRTSPFSEFVHGSFFHDRERDLILVQVLDAIQLATRGERRSTPNVEITVDGSRLHVTAARVVWPQTRDVAVVRDGERLRIVLEKPDRYTAMYLKVG